jgi:phosphoribosylformimino-5-aminoimidazole carboxamide ribotide isomerase
MKIIPVLDILNGVVVHAVRGKREEYLPIRSVLCTSAKPVDVALAFKSIRFNQLYLADLDAILSNILNLGLYKQIKADTGLDLMVDAGIADLEKARKVLESEVSEIIIGTETLNKPDFVRQAIESFGEDRVIVSLDLKEGKVMSVSEVIRSMDPLEAASAFQEMGVTRIIILDLARVGTGQGVNLAIVREILEKVKVEVLTGGGVRDIKDLEPLRQLGVSGALLATALHSGRITVEELNSAGFL